MKNIEDTKPIDVLADRVWAGDRYYYPKIEMMIADLTRLRKIEAECKAAGFVTEKGEVRRIDTRGWDPSDPDRAVPLPTYADGEIWMMGEDYYTIRDGEVVEFYSCDHALSWTASGWVVRWGDGEIELSRCYSTPEAARAAKENA